MGDEDAPTGVAPTSVVEAVEAEPATAWSEDDGEDWPRQRSWWPVLAVAAVSLAVVGIAIGAAYETLRGQPATTPPAAEVTTTVVSTAPEPTVEPTFKADVPDAGTLKPPPPPPSPTVVLTPLDAQFLAALRKDGFEFSNSAGVLQDAALVCKKLRSGVDLPEISQQMADETPLDVGSAHVFASEVLLTYPSCHMP